MSLSRINSYSNFMGIISKVLQERKLVTHTLIALPLFLLSIFSFGIPGFFPDSLSLSLKIPVIEKENYQVFREYIKCILPPLTKMMGPIMILINGTHNFCERREYVFNVLRQYLIITPLRISFSLTFISEGERTISITCGIQPLASNST